MYGRAQQLLIRAETDRTVAEIARTALMLHSWARRGAHRKQARPSDAQVVAALEAFRSQKRAAAALGVEYDSFRARCARMRKRDRRGVV